MDKFLVFSLSLEDQAFINQHRPPPGECALLKFVALDQIDHARNILKKMGIKTRVKFRGPRYDLGRYTTRKKDAVHVSIYRKNTYVSKH